MDRADDGDSVVRLAVTLSALPYEDTQRLDHGLRHVRVQSARRLVAEQDARVVDELGGQRHAAHLAARNALYVDTPELDMETLGEVEVLHDLGLISDTRDAPIPAGRESPPRSGRPAAESPGSRGAPPR